MLVWRLPAARGWRTYKLFGEGFRNLEQQSRPLSQHTIILTSPRYERRNRVCLDLGAFQPNMRKKKENIVADFMATFAKSRDLDLYPQSPNSEHRTQG
jgi:hypothetical protein